MSPPGAGQNADEDTNDGALQNQRKQRLKLRPAGQEVTGNFGLHLDIGAALAPLLGLNHDLGEGEQTDHGGHQGDAAQQNGQTEGEAGICVGGQADQSGHQAQSTGHQALDHGLAGQAGNQGQAKDGDEEVLRGAEEQGHLGQRRRNEQQRDGAEQAADTGGNGGQANGLQCLALLGHGITVQTGGSRAGGAGRMDQNGRDGAAIDGRGVDGGQHNQGRRGIHAVCNGNQKGNAHGGAQAGQRADDHAADNADCQANQRINSK